MPYRLSQDNKCVQQEKNGEWTDLKCHDTPEMAKAHLAALEANVSDAKMPMMKEDTPPPDTSIQEDGKRFPVQTAMLIEQLDLSEAVLNTDNQTVRQTIIKAGLSANKRLYSEDVLKRSTPLFEGVQTYANHPTPTQIKNGEGRDIRQTTGWITDVVYDNGKVIGTRHFAETAAGRDAWGLVKQIIENHAPSTLMGASINALGKGRKERHETHGDILVIEGIERVLSVDDVDTPAAGGGFERLVAGGGYLQDLFAVMDYNEFIEARPEFVERLKKEWKVARQDDAVKAAQAEADRITRELENAKTALKSVVSEREHLLTEVESVRRELAIEKTRRNVHLNETWEKELREDLKKSPLDEWGNIIERKIKLAKSSSNARVPIKGASQSTVTTTAIGKPDSLMPNPGENADSWFERVKASNKG
jgi:hypothetical protein